MSEIDDVEFNQLRAAFNSAFFDIERNEWRRDLSNSKRIVDRNTKSIIDAFNALGEYLNPVHEAGDLRS